MIELADRLYWTSVVLVALALATSVIGRSIWLDKAESVSLAGVIGAFAVLTVSLAARWSGVGHGPYLATYEAAGSYAWVLLGLLLALAPRTSQLRASPALVLAPALLLLGLGVTGDNARQFESPAMSSVWLWVHVAFAKLSLASLVLGTALAVHAARSPSTVTASATGPGVQTGRDADPGCASLRLSEGLVDAGFFMLALVISSGAIWARTAWGAYWTWDPIESWALATWMAFGAVIHARRMWDLSNARWARITVLASVASAVLFIGLRTLSLSPHWIYSG